MTLGVSVPRRGYENGFSVNPSTNGTVTIAASSSKVTVACGALNDTDVVHVSQTATSASQANVPIFEIHVDNGVNVRQTGTQGQFVLGINGAQQNFTITPSAAPDAGTFTITYNGKTTSSLAFGATAAQIQTAVSALSNVGANNVTVAGTMATTVVVTFRGALMRTDTPAITATSSLTNSSNPVTLAITDSTTTLTNSVTVMWMVLKG